MPTNCSSESSFMRQLSEKEKGGGGWKATKSNRWTTAFDNNKNREMRDDWMEGGGGGIRMMKEKRKRVMVVVDESLHTKHAMLWALTHVANKGDILTLLHIITTTITAATTTNNHLVTSLASLCKACKPEVEVEALVIQGGKLETVVSQVKKLEVSVLVLGQKNSSPFLLLHCLGGMSRTEKFVEQCINTVECLTIGVRKQSKGVGGYLISTRWRKDFWLLA